MEMINQSKENSPKLECLIYQNYQMIFQILTQSFTICKANSNTEISQYLKAHNSKMDMKSFHHKVPSIIQLKMLLGLARITFNL